MKFYPNQYFHIYNQGNNKRNLFFRKGDYEIFLLKLGAYLSPFGSIVAYCLMPNHYHLLFYVEKVIVSGKSFKDDVDHYFIDYFKHEIFKRNLYLSQTKTINNHVVTLNRAIGILERSYTRVINKQYDWSGSMFRSNCKAKDGWISEFVTVGQKKFLSGNDYVQQCFNYIHENPVRAGLVIEPEDWLHSSARDYKNLRDKSICKLTMGRGLI